MTTAELVTLVKSRTGIDSTAAISDAQIVGFLNQCQQELCADSQILVSCWTTSTVASQQQYSVPGDYSAVDAVRIYSTNQKLWLAKVGLEELDPAKGTGDPRRFAVRGLNVSGANSVAIWLDPIPSSNGSSDLELFARQTPLTMVSGGQGPEVSIRWQYALVDGASAMCYLRLANGDPNFLPLADRSMALWKRDKEVAESLSFLDYNSPINPRDTFGYTQNWNY